MQENKLERVEESNKKDIIIGISNLVGITIFTVIGLIIKNLMI